MPGKITLAQWRKAQGISQKETAGRLSAMLGRPVHAPSVCQWESGGVMPGADVAEAVRTMTGGAVTGSSFGRRPAVNAQAAASTQVTEKD